MNILIDIGHPAHVHVFCNFAHEMQKRGHKVLFTCRNKEFIINLLQGFGLDYVSLGQKYTTTLKKIWGLVEFDFKLYQVARKFKPDIFLSLGSMYAAQVAWFMSKPHICFEDTYNKEQVRLYEPFTKMILTGDYPHPVISKKEFYLAGYNELAYLYPTRFKPDPSVLDELGIKSGEKYVVIRFVAWNATHDLGHKGMSARNKIGAVNELAKHAKVFISSEGKLPDELREFHLPTAPNRIHHVIFYSSLVYGESSTMAEEAAMMGVPSIFFNNNSTYYTQHLERDYSMMFNFGESSAELNKGLQKAIELLDDNQTRTIFNERAQAMLKDRIDVTAFLLWLVENYPTSIQELVRNPDKQLEFR